MNHTTSPTPRSGKERGVILVWFALMATVFLGIGAIVIDYSLLLSERQQLQNGADAAALAVAVGCVKANCGDPAAVATQYASLNASDGVSAATACGVGSGLSACSVVPAGMSGSVGYVKVTTSTLNTDGTDKVRFVLAPLLNILSSNAALTATSTVEWGTPSSADAIAMALSTCSFSRSWIQSDGSLVFPSSPVVIRISSSTCNGNSINGFDYLLPQSAGTCQQSLTLTGATTTAQGTSGASAACRQVMIDAFDADATVTVPIFTQKFNNTLTINGFASFQPCGFWLTGSPKIYNKCPNLSLCNTTMTNLNQRICGWFRPATSTNGTLGSGTDYGSRIIKVAQ